MLFQFTNLKLENHNNERYKSLEEFFQIDQ